MIRLHIIAEGNTEKRFVEELLCSHLGQFDVVTDVCCVMTKRDYKAGLTFKGGLPNYQKARNDIIRRINSDDHPECRFTTMFDLYALPNDFPGYQTAQKGTNPYNKISVLENALSEDINDGRFIPYIQLHEFEALIFSDPQKLSVAYLESQHGIDNLIKLSQKEQPEEINESFETAPSKRIMAQIAGYDKVYAGYTITEAIGLEKIRDRCQHFNEWLTKLENLSQ